MSSQSIQPLRIQKSTPASSPVKMSGSATQRPLSELGSTERRRNSPSYHQGTKKMLFSENSSPFETSPYNAASSPRLFWQGRDPASPSRFAGENKNPLDRDTSPAPTKRSSIENLKRASRVKNSNMFAREHKQDYDPTQSPIVDRPLAIGRPLVTQVQGNAYGGRGLEGFRKEISCDMKAKEGGKQISHQFFPSAQKQDAVAPLSPSKAQVSPAKSSLSKASRYGNRNDVFDAENGIWSEDDDGSILDRKLPEGRILHRHAKSVTFDAAPPQVNEYEMTTPDPSSVASGSREGSYDSHEDEEEESFDRGSSIDRDDSFDESLEDTDKTPVVLPEDWSFMSPGISNQELIMNMEDPFEPDVGSPEPSAHPSTIQGTRPAQTRVESTDSDGQPRPLPPLPALGAPVFPKPRSDSNSSLTATVERTSSAQRTLPSPPRPASISKSEIKGMGGSSMPLEDRLKLMMRQEQERGQSEAEKQRERRMRRAGAKERSVEREDSPGTGLNFQSLTLEEDVPGAVRQLENLRLDGPVGLDNTNSPPRISRESILRKIQSQNFDCEDSYDYSSPQMGSSPERHFGLDPDHPIPSIENIAVVEEEEEEDEEEEEEEEEEEKNTVVIKTEPLDDETDLYAVPDLYAQHQHVVSKLSFYEQNEADDASQYSQPAVAEDENQSTPRAQSPNRVLAELDSEGHRRPSLPEFSSNLENSIFALGLGPCFSPSSLSTSEPTKVEPHSKMASMLDDLKRPITPEEQLLLPPKFAGFEEDGEAEPSTPDSVIRHPVRAESPQPDSPSIPEPVATIKAPDGRLKTRPSINPADMEFMRETRRQVSGQVPDIPPIPERHCNRPSLTLNSSPFERPTSKDSDVSRDSQGLQDSHQSQESSADTVDSQVNYLTTPSVTQGKRKSSLVQLEIPVSQSDEGLFGLDKEFDRVIEAQKVAYNLSYPQTQNQDVSFSRQESTGPTQTHGGAEYMGTSGFTPNTTPIANRSALRQRGYLMRQNTKVIVASSRNEEEVKADLPAALESPEKDSDGRGTKSAGCSPRKGSNTKTWTTEPWNGKIRRKSIRVPSAESPRKKKWTGPAPPLPGQTSNVSAGLGSVEEDQGVEENEDSEEGTERGRVFVKVVGVKDLDLPLPKGERSYFALTLDNGLHCVTTAWLELGKTAPIGQEFELVVLNELEFQLTLQMKLEEPKPVKAPESPIKAPKVEKMSTFSRVFASPKKRKELELRQQLEAAQVKEQKPKNKQPTAWDLLNGLVARDGSFARAYICLSDHEKQAFGRSYTVDVPCYNEWASEDTTTSSFKSKRSQVGDGIQRRPPYQVGKLELQLLYVPKPKGAKDEDMPKSMNACIREMKEAENTATKNFEGHLSQQGGDCPYWRRRLFKLSGSKLTAYHDMTHQPRATINLAKAAKLIDDKSALTQKETSTKGGGRRKSAFAEEEEGYMFVEEGFRIRFANGEVIDFYADSAVEKDGWMKVLSDVVGKDSKAGSDKRWTEMVLKRERSNAAKVTARATGHSRKGSGEKEKVIGVTNVNSMKSAPTSPVKKDMAITRPQSQSGLIRPGFSANAPAPLEKSPRHQQSEQIHSSLTKGKSGLGLTGGMPRAERDKKVRSMFM